MILVFLVFSFVSFVFFFKHLKCFRDNNEVVLFATNAIKPLTPGTSLISDVPRVRQIVRSIKTLDQ